MKGDAKKMDAMKAVFIYNMKGPVRVVNASLVPGGRYWVTGRAMMANNGFAKIQHGMNPPTMAMAE
jgi:hypothetical protein